MAATTTLYDSIWTTLLGPGGDWMSSEVKLALLGNTYVPDTSAATFASVAAHEVAGTNYPAGGRPLTGKALSRTGSTTFLDAASLTFPALTATFRYGVLYVAGTVDGVVDPLLACIQLDTVEVALTAKDYPIEWQEGHIVRMSGVES
jgi:hypothetical protein